MFKSHATPLFSSQSLSSFRMEVNLLRAQAGQEAINVEEALRYLRPNQFHSAKSLDIYKNYQVRMNTQFSAETLATGQVYGMQIKSPMEYMYEEMT